MEETSGQMSVRHFVPIRVWGTSRLSPVFEPRDRRNVASSYLVWTKLSVNDDGREGATPQIIALR